MGGLNVAPTPAAWAVDTSSPTASITAPAAGSSPVILRSVTGTSSDVGDGVQRVEVRIKRLSDNLYWAGADPWVSTQAWISATGTVNWSYAAPFWDTNGVYEIAARAYDVAGNVSPLAVSSFTYAGWTLARITQASAALQPVAVGAARLDAKSRVYAGGANGRLYEVTWSGGWTSFDFTMAGSGNVVSGTALAPIRGDGVARLYGVGGSGGVYEASFDGAAWSVATIAAPAAAQTAAAAGAGRGDGVTRLYVGALNGQLTEWTYAGGIWTSSAVGTAGSAIRGLAVAAVRGAGAVYAALAGGSVAEFAWTGSTWTQTAVGATVGPAWAVAAGAGRGDGATRLYAGADGALSEFAWSGSTWGARVDLGGGAMKMSAVAIGAARSDGLVRVYGANDDGHLYEYLWTGSVWSGVTAASVAVAGLSGLAAGNGRSDGAIRLYAADRSGGLWEITHGSGGPGTGSAPAGGAPPDPVVDLQAMPLDGGAVQLAWVEPLASDVVSYRIYLGTGALTYLSPWQTAAAPSRGTVIYGLAAGSTYRIVVRAVNLAGTEESNTAAVAVVPVAAPGGVGAAIRSPWAGLKVAGTQIMLLADVVRGTAAQVREVRFESAAGAPSGWQAIGTDPSPPYAVAWDASPYASGTTIYLRAVAVDRSGAADAVAPAVSVVADPSDPDLEEKDLPSGGHQKRERITAARGGTVKITAPGRGTVVQVTLPSGALTGPTDRLKIILQPGGLPMATTGLNPTGDYLDIGLESGQTTFPGSRTATLVMPFQDAEGDGRLDAGTGGAGLAARTLLIGSYDGGVALWRPITSTVDPAARQVVGVTSHFSLFGLFGAPAADLSGLKVYPNPFRPLASTKGLTFTNLSLQSRVQIYTLTGAVAWDSGQVDVGDAVWNGKNADGEVVATGLYYYAVTAPGEKRLGKIAVVK